MSSNAALVAAIYLVLGSMFLLGVFIGATTTITRAIVIITKGRYYPTLLTRDVITFGGLAISFGLITAVRFLSPEQRAELTTGNVWWALVSTVPAVVGVLTYVYFEVAVIKLDDGPEPAGEVALESSVQENIALTKDAKVAADAAFEVANHSNAKIASLTEALGHKEDKA